MRLNCHKNSPSCERFGTREPEQGRNGPPCERAEIRALAAWIIALLAVVPTATEDLAAQNIHKAALVIGNGGYTYVQQLPNPTHDAALIATTLKGLGFDLIGDGPQTNLTLVNFRAALQQFSTSAETADVGVVYYAGHGLQANGINYLVPIDANPVNGMSDVPSQMIDASSILNALDRGNIRLKVMILDACRNNPFVSRGLLPTKGLADMSRGLTAMSAPEGTVIWYATQPGNVAQDGAGDNGPFALAISHNITLANRDIYTVFNQTGLEVMKVTNNIQQPWLAATPLDGTFYFKQADGGTWRSFFGTLKLATKASDRVRQLFSNGITTPSRAFAFGDSYEDVNKKLDSPFRISSWDALPRATEYKETDVRYYWVPLTSLPVVLSAIVPSGSLRDHCVDPSSYISFFFREQKLFHISVRFYKGQTCSSYGWLLSSLFSGEHHRALIHSPDGDTDVATHEDSDFSYVEITKDDPTKLWLD